MDELAHTLMFWRNYCLGHRISYSTVERGEQIIKDDPVYWADNSMRKLWDRIDEENK